MSSTLGVAASGPVSMSTGSEPTTALATMRARGVRFSSLTFSPLIRTTAEAPSVTGLEMPAVIQSVPRTGFKPASFSRLVSGRIVSSLSRTISFPSLSSPFMGMISFLK